MKKRKRRSWGNSATVGFVLPFPRACGEAGFAPQIVSRSSHWDFMAALVRAGVGIALLPAPYCRRLDPSQFTCRPVIEPEIRWEMAIAWRKTGYLSHAARAWLDVARETLPGQPGDDFVYTRSDNAAQAPQDD